MIQRFGQSAFRLAAESDQIVIDPFGEMGDLSARGMRFDYPQISGVSADLVLVTHEHADHNGVGALAGSPPVIRSTAGTVGSPLGEIVAVASEHDDVAGTQRGPNTILVFSLNGMRICHMGDFGQAFLRRERRRAIDEIDLLFLPVGGGPTIGGRQAAGIARELRPRLIVPMHFRTPAVDFLEAPTSSWRAPRGRIGRPGASEVEVGGTDRLARGAGRRRAGGTGALDVARAKRHQKNTRKQAPTNARTLGSLLVRHAARRGRGELALVDGRAVSRA